MPRKRPYRAITSIDPAELAAFQAGIRRRYSDEDILEQLRACAERLGRSPTMKEFGDDPETTVHPQTVIEHFGTWNKAKRAAGMVPRRFATREELLGLLQELGRRLGRVPTAKDVDANRGWMPSKSLYWHTFGSLTNALKEAGFDVPVGEERLERAIAQGAAMARRLGHLPKFTDWARGTQGRRVRCSPSGRSTGCSTRGEARGRRSSTSCGSGSRRRASRSSATARYAANSTASRARQNSPSSGARTVGRVSGS